MDWLIYCDVLHDINLKPLFDIHWFVSVHKCRGHQAEFFHYKPSQAKPSYGKNIPSQAKPKLHQKKPNQAKPSLLISKKNQAKPSQAGKLK